jgi:hypothetical protein
MKFKDINWNKKLLVFFGDEVTKMKGEILSKTPPVVFPEHVMTHPWEHIDYIEKVTQLISNDNRKIVIVTNSSYIIDHLVNLMKGARIDADARFTRCKSKGAFINKKDVGVYACTGGKIEDALPKKGEIIKWDNLSEPSEWLSDVYFEMEKK